MHPFLANAPAVIFDFDGVLVDSEPLHEEAIRRVAASRGWSMTRGHFHQMVGKGDEHAFELLARVHAAAVSLADIAGLCLRKHTECLALIHEGRFSLQPAAAELVRLTADAVPIAVCSGSRREVVLGMLTATGLLSLFRTVVTHEDVNRPKPDPEGYLLAARRLGIAEPRRCVVIEDSPTGIRAGRAAGMRVIAVCHSFGPGSLAEAELVLPTIQDLLR